MAWRYAGTWNRLEAPACYGRLFLRQQSWQQRQHWPADLGSGINFERLKKKNKKQKGVCNVPCLLLRWSRCLLCWCSFLRWQEDLRGQRRNCCYVEKKNNKAEKFRSIGVCKFPLEGKAISFQRVSYWCCGLIHFTHPIYLRTIVRISSAPPEQKDCVSGAVWTAVPGHQSFTNKSPSVICILCASLMKWPPAGRSWARPAPFHSPRRHRCFRLNCLFFRPESDQAALKHRVLLHPLLPHPHPLPPTPAPAPLPPMLTDVLIQVWEEMPQETISRLLKSGPRPRESVHTPGWRPCTLMSYAMSRLREMQAFYQPVISFIHFWKIL